MSKILYGVAATDPVTYGAVALLLCAIAAAASWIPARRAVRIDPIAGVAGRVDETPRRCGGPVQASILIGTAEL